MAAPTTGAGAATARPSTTNNKTYAAFFLGQGGYTFSWGVSTLEQEARKLGITTRVYEYSDVNIAWADIARRRKEGYRIALVGYSLGNTTATYIQQHVSVDLLLAIAESSLGQNHPVRKQNTRRAVLWWGPDTLSNAGTRDGFDITNYVDNTHLLMDVDPRVVRGVLAELRAFAARSTPVRPPLTTIPGRRAAAPPDTGDNKSADGKTGGDKTADNKAADGKTPDGKSADNKAPDGKSADNKTPDGKSADSKSADDNKTAARARPAVDGAPPAAARDDAGNGAARQDRRHSS